MVELLGVRESFIVTSASFLNFVPEGPNSISPKNENDGASSFELRLGMYFTEIFLSLSSASAGIFMLAALPALTVPPFVPIVAEPETLSAAGCVFSDFAEESGDDGLLDESPQLFLI